MLITASSHNDTGYIITVKSDYNVQNFNLQLQTRETSAYYPCEQTKTIKQAPRRWKSTQQLFGTVRSRDCFTLTPPVRSFLQSIEEIQHDFLPHFSWKFLNQFPSTITF